MKLILWVLSCFLGLTAYTQKPAAIVRADTSVGDILFNKSIDDSSFRLCDPVRVFQYYNTDAYFLDHKDSFSRYFLSNYKPVPGVEGYITVKFIINCEGSTGRFRLSEMDRNYQPCHFDQRISGQLLSLVRALKNWEPALYKGKHNDSYQYITFHLQNGKIVSISP